MPVARHPLLRSLSFRPLPVICGLNDVRPRAHGLVVLQAKKLDSHSDLSGRSPHAQLATSGYPLLVIDDDPHKRIAAFATDLAPHWCGGLVDWGTRRVTLPVTKQIHIEVGDRYVQLVSSLLHWLARVDKTR